MTPDSISAAFMQQGEKKSWKSRVFNDTVHFSTTNGMVAFIYHVTEGRFAVKFQRFQGAWGDYIAAIARGLFYILNTLKSAGLPFEAPPSLEGCVIEATTGADNTVWARWADISAPNTLPPIL